MKRKLLTAAMACALGAGSAHATVLSGTVTGGSSGGSFVKLTPGFTESDPDNTVGDDNLQSPDIFVFDEKQNVSSEGVIVTDIGSNVPAGATVASHYIVFDPGPTQTIRAQITFDAPIFGVATSSDNLDASDFLANVGINYASDTLRGLESSDMVSIINPTTLEVFFRASSPGDSIRVFTELSPTAAEVPVPAALWLFGAGAAGFAGLRRRSA